MKQDNVQYLITVILVIAASYLSFLLLSNVVLYVIDAIASIMALLFIYSIYQLEKKQKKLKTINEFLEESTQGQAKEIEKLSLVAKMTDNMVFIVTAQGILEWANNSFCRVTGYEYGEVQGSRVKEILKGSLNNEDDLQRIRKAIATKTAFTEEIIIYSKTEEKIWLSLNLTPMMDENNEIDKFIVIGNDITKQKQTEEQIQKLVALIEGSPNLIAITSMKGDLEYLNFAGTQMLGLDDISYLRTQKEENGEYKEISFEQYFQTIHRSQWEGEDELYNQKKQQSLPVHVNAFTIKKEHSNIPLGLGIIATDISYQKKAQQELLQAAVKLQSYLDATSIIFITIDKNQQITFINNRGCEILGYSREEIIGKNSFDNFVSMSNRESVRESFNKLFESDNISEFLIQKTNILTKNGKERTILWHNTKLNDEQGNIKAILSSGEDITEIRKEERKKKAEYEVTKILSEAASMLEVAPKILKVICECLYLDFGAIWTIDHQIEQLRCIETWHNPHIDIHEFEALTRQVTFPKGIGLPGRVWKENQAAWISDVTKDDNFPRVSIAFKEGLHGAFAFPISNGQAIGVIEFFSKEIWEPDESLHNMMSSMGRQIEQFIIRKETEEALQQSEEQFKALFNQAAIGMSRTSLEGKFLEVNQKLCDITGYTKAELESMTFMDITHQDDMDTSLKRMGKVLKGNINSFSIEKRYIRKDKTIIMVSLSTNLLHDSHGNPDYFVSSFEDITERKKIEEEIRKSQNFLNSIVDNIPNMVFIKDAKTLKIITINKAAEELLGYSRDEIIGKTVYDFLPKEGADFLTTKDRIVLDGRKLHITPEEQMYTRNQGIRILETKTLPLFDNHGNPQYILGISNDITERKQVENALRNAANEIYDLYNNAPCGYHSVDKDGVFVDINETELIWLGYTREEVIGKMKMTDIMTAESISSFRKKFPLFMEQGWLSNCDYNFIRKDGSIFPVLLNSTSVKDKEGNYLKSRTTIYNIADRKKIEEELLQAKQLAEESLKVKEQFLANISHEIRTPMHGIIGLTNLLLNTKLVDEQKESLDAIKISADNLLVLINEILDISKIELGKMNIGEYEFNLFKVVNSAVDLLKPRAVEKKLNLSVDIDKKIPQALLGDSVRLNQIILNLVSNAIKFTEKGKINITLSLLSQDNEKVKLNFIVQDTGIGIPEDKLDTIFESFTQADKDTARKYGGAGLGLSIVKNLIEIQGGTITVKSKMNQGSAFIFQLEFKKAMTKKKTLAPSFKDINIRELGKLKILLAEDHLINQLLAKKILTAWGFEIDTAEDGAICLEKVKGNNYDIVLMDIQMPELDGYQVTRLIRDTLDSPKNKIPIIAMTAYATPGEEKKCFDAGMNDYLSKPFHPNDLLALIARQIIKVDVPIHVTHHKKINKPKSIHNQNNIHINLSYLYELADGSKEFVVDMIKAFIHQTPPLLQDLKEAADMAVDKNDWKALKTLAHRMKPSFSFVGIKHLEKVIDMVEEYASAENNLEAIPELISTLENISMLAIEELKAELQKMEGTIAP